MATLRPVDWSVASKKPRDETNTVNVSLVESIDREGHRFDPHTEDRHIQLWHPAKPVFDASSTYHDEYPGWQPPPRMPPQAPAAVFGAALAQGAPPSMSTMKSHYSAPRNSAGLEPYTRAGSQTLADSADIRFDDRTSYAADYEAPPLPKRVPGSGVSWAEASNGVSTPFAGKTTTQADYTAKEIAPRRRQPPQTMPVFEPDKQPAPVTSVASVPFEGQTSYHNDFPAHEIPARGPRAPLRYAPEKAYFMNQPKLDGTTTTGEAFKGWRLASNRPSLGVETVNDGMHMMIPRTQPLPAVHTEIFTTVTDNQTELEITILQGESNRASQNKVLGSFELVGIPPAPCAEQQIAVTFVVGRDYVLRVEAVDHEGNHQSIAISKIKNTEHFADPQQQGFEQHYATGQ